MPRSLARKNDGCYECCKRRLRCDKTEPECQKCQKKGIQCSGQGLRCRFSSHMKLVPTPASTRTAPSPRSRARKPQTPTSPSAFLPSTVSQASSNAASSPGSSVGAAAYSPNLTQWTDQDAEPRDAEAEDATQMGTDLGKSPAAATSSPSINSEQDEYEMMLPLVRRRSTPLRAALDEPLSPQARMLFDHFCTHVAPIMVVFDFAGNGYRDIILPLAVHDDVLSRAVSVVAAFHLAQKAPHLRQAALAGHSAIVGKLRRDSLELRPDQLFTPYTWATIMVLLVGETITAADNYIYLLEMLTCLRQSPEAIGALPPALRGFFVQQVKMFELFGFPLSDESKGLDIIQRNPDHYMEFIAYPTLPATSEHQANIHIMRGAIRDACGLYQRRVLSSSAPEDSIPQLEWLRQSVLPLEAHTPGAHALVWTYFVAAAESVLPEHRDFFSSRLRELHGYTGFGSIPAALRALDTIWAQQGVRRWTEIIAKDLPVLVM